MKAERPCIVGSGRSYWRRLAPYLRCRAFVVAAVLVYFCGGSPLFAQDPPIAERLPQNTLLYVQWRGKAFLDDADKKNHVLQLLEDPDFEALRQAFAKNLLQRQQKNGSAVQPLELSDLISLLDNPATFGFIVSAAPSKAGSADASSHLGSVFLVYDTTGKADLVKKLKAAGEAASKEKPQVSTYDFGGTSIEVRTEGANASASYSARTPHYFLFASQKETIEDLVRRFSSANKPATSVTQLSEYQATRAYVGSDAAVEYFARVPEFDKWIPADQTGQQVAKFIRNLHLDKIHAAAGGISFSGPVLRAHGALLGDTSAPSLFDIVGANSAAFQTQQIVASGPYFSIFQFNFSELYQMIREAALATVTPQQAVGLTGAEAMAQGFLGMSITDALQLFTGEVASQLSFTPEGESQRLFALAIQKPPDVLKILRTSLSKMIATENTSGDTTYLDLSYPSHDPANGQEHRSLYYLAVTPQFIIAAPHKEMVREAVARINGKPATAADNSILSNADFIHWRSLMPEQVSGIGAADMAQIPWDKVITRYVQQMEQAEKQSNQKNPPSTEWLHSIKPGMFNRHLHMIASGWWKDANGIYFDYYVQ